MRLYTILLLITMAWILAGCAGLPERSYSFTYTDQAGQSISAGVRLGPTRSFKK